MNILVTGGLGYIGSHTVVELLSNNHEVVVIDNLYNSQLDTIGKIEEITNKTFTFYNIDATNYEALDELCKKYKFDGIIHFAGYKAVGESVSKPLMYYYNNLLSTINLSLVATKYNIPKFIFSSSATVYGAGASPLNEEMELLPRTNPYGETKAMSERILTDASLANGNFNVVLLRYFNPVGAHKSGLIGEVPNGIPNNLMPYVTQTAKGLREKVYVFGDDYDTIDGTGVRDYIHVVDLARGHLLALEKDLKGVNIYNLGTGCGTSVLELINTFIKVNNVSVPYEFAPRRDGDLATCYANTKKAFDELGFKTKYSLSDMVRDAWNFEVKHK